MRIVLLFVVLSLQQCNSHNHRITMIRAEQEEKTKIIETYSAVFLNSDAHRWNNVKSLFADTVHLDYTSLSGLPSADMKSADVIKAWSSFLPKFNFTMHYLTNHLVSIHENHATASCYGHAIHQLKGAEGGDFWEVYGTYDIELQKMNDGWKIISLRYNHKYAGGNLNLPALASK